MLESIHIQGFKGFRDTQIGPLRKVNLIVGGQNVGKTSLLEAVYAGDFVTHQLIAKELGFLTNRQNVPSPPDRFGKKVLEARFRDIPSQREMDWIKTSNYRKGVDIKIEGDARRMASFSTLPIKELELVGLYDIAVHAKTKTKLVSLLRLTEQRLNGIESVAPKGEKAPCLHADLDYFATLVPLSQLGQGFNRLTYLYAGLLGQNADVALIDEIENGIHYSALPILWQGIANIARELDIQIFATTHSWDCIRAACEVFADSPEDFQVIRLERTEDNIRAVCIDGERMQRLMADDREVR